jgi:type II secretory pathway predicted ATPase ExeA
MFHKQNVNLRNQPHIENAMTFNLRKRKHEPQCLLETRPKQQRIDLSGTFIAEGGSQYIASSFNTGGGNQYFTSTYLNSDSILLDRLSCAKDAAFDSYQDEHDARCLENTRVDLRRQISEWAEYPDSKCIFWLNGMAGTGKSTISRTIAQSFEEKGLLGASFFFKRGEGDRGNASKFFTTIAHQLVMKVPRMVQSIMKAIDLDPNISEKSLAQQFEKLILTPLSQLYASSQASSLVLVIDALDECERGEDIRTILRLLTRAKSVASISLRIFVTSRPELPIRLGFKNMSDGIYQDLVLHDIPKATIEHDISTYLKHEFAEIRANNDEDFAQDWPGEESIQTLVQMAIPLFIFAATVCRFIADPIWDPKKRLETILQYRMAENISKFDKTYLPILNQQLIKQDTKEKEMLIQQFKEIVGAIIILADPLSIGSLASLLDFPKEIVKSRLRLLHSVLDIPPNEDAPVRLFHLSFRDFLLDHPENDKNPFRMNEREIHKRITSKCLQLMSSPECLKENMCNLDEPGTLRTQVDKCVVDKHLPAHVQYACRYWIYHIQGSKEELCDDCLAHKFLQKHFLHWLEALSLMGNISEGITAISSLESYILVSQSSFREFLLINTKG